MKTIQLTRGLVAVVDDLDYELLGRHRWRAHDNRDGKFYACRSVGEKTVMLHRVILDAKQGELVDHKNGDGLNCTRNNLRICSPTGNVQNSKKRKDNSSGYKGVGWHKQTGKWRAYINVARKHKSLGYFNDPVEAARAYDAAALVLFGEYAHPNFGG